MRGFIQMHSNEHSLFATPIWGFVLKSEAYHALDYIDLIQEISQTEPSTVKSNFGGYQTRDNLHQEGVLQEFIKLLNSLVDEITTEHKLPPLKLISMWGNINNKRDFNGAHTHEGVISGVFYLKVPKNSGKLILCNPITRSHNSPIKHNNFGIQPENLACILFPSWLEHYVEPSMSDEPRISISFNYDLRDRS